jgi:beta-galactosidase/beta-glucuronidase
VNVSSHDEFKRLLAVYVADNAEPVSFNVSKNVDTESYGCIMKDILDSNSKWNRRDKIKHPRSDHFPRPAVSCETTEKMKNVYDAIGPYWRVVMRVCPDSNPKLFYQMDDYRMDAGIQDREIDPY